MQPSLSPVENLAPAARTVVIACAEAGACDATCKSLLGEHALVLRSHGGDVSAAARGALPGLLAGRAIERVVVLAHTACASRQVSEPMANTAVLAAWHRLAPAVGALARERAAGLEQESFSARLEALVQLANLESCSELHASLRRGEVSAHAAVYDARDGSVALFDGNRFARIDSASFARLISGQTAGGEAAHERDPQSGVHPRPYASASQRAECAAQGSC